MGERLIPRFGEIQYRVTPQRAYGVLDNYDQATGEYDYLAGLEVDRVDRLPEGMTRWDVPAQTYAAFGTTLADLHATLDAIYGQWLPSAAYVRTDGPEFEFYDEQFDQTGRMAVYIPVQLREGQA